MKNKKHNDLTKKLMAYSTAAGAVMAFGANQVQGQIVYTDVDPDEIITGTSYNLDLNNDATTDIILTQGSWFTGYQTAKIQPQGGAGFISTAYPPFSGWGTYTWAQALSAGDMIDNTGTFNSNSANSTMSLGWVGGYAAGPFLGETEKFLGLRFTLDGGSTYHYGWARVSLDATAAMITLHDFAYESTADAGIEAGQTVGATPAGTATNLMPMDIGDMNSGADLQLTFDSAMNEASVAEYRAMVVDSAAAETFTLDMADTVSTGNYVSVTPDGSVAYTINFDGIFKVNGDTIMENEPYKLFVLSIADGTIATENSLSDSSETITLINSIGIVENNAVETKVYLADEMLKVEFSKAINEADLAIYDMYGKIIFREILAHQHNNVRVPAIERGVYIVKITLDGQEFIEKIVF